MSSSQIKQLAQNLVEYSLSASNPVNTLKRKEEFSLLILSGQNKLADSLTSLTEFDRQSELTVLKNYLKTLDKTTKVFDNSSPSNRTDWADNATNMAKAYIYDVLNRLGISL